MLLLEYQTIGHLQEWSGESMEGLTLFSAGLRKSQMWDILNVRLWDYGGTTTGLWSRATVRESVVTSYEKSPDRPMGCLGPGQRSVRTRQDVGVLSRSHRSRMLLSSSAVRSSSP